MQTTEYKITVSHWPFSDQFYCMANQLLVGHIYWSVSTKYRVTFSVHGQILILYSEHVYVANLLYNISLSISKIEDDTTMQTLLYACHHLIWLSATKSTLKAI